MLPGFLIGVIMLFTNTSSADWVSPYLYPSKYDSTLYPVNKIKFSGNKNFSDAKLLEIISTKETLKSTIFQILEGYYEEGKRNSYTPKSILRALEKPIDRYSTNLDFFSKPKVIGDSSSISNFYVKNGYHDALVNIKFFPDSSSNENVLLFDIKEGTIYSIENITLNGLDTLPELVRESIDKIKVIEQGDKFSESKVLELGYRINKLLNNRGYKNSSYVLEKVVMDTTAKTDSINIEFNPGMRLKFGKISLVHLRLDNKKISDQLIYEQLGLKEGNFYNKSKIDEGQSNLFDLGVFNSVKIDSKMIDSVNKTVDLLVTLEYRNQRSYELKAGLNRTDDNFTNIFGTARMTHQNIFGGAQLLQPSVNVLYRDINDLNNSRANTGREYFFRVGEGGLPQPDEYNLTLNYFEPSFTKIGDARVLFNFKPGISQRRIFEEFNIVRISLPFIFPIRFKTDLDVSHLNFKFLLESERTNNFDVIANPGENIDPAVAERLIEANVTYEKLDSYSSAQGAFPITALQFGFAVSKDERNNNFYPSNGYLIDLQGDISSPQFALSKYVRLVTDFLYFKRLNSRLVFATKLKAGKILFYNNDSTYVPLDKQFYSGGANSVRGWAARKLRFSNYYDSSLVSSGAVGFLENYVGNTSLLEFSMELRYDLKKPIGLNNFFGWLIGESTVSLFFDGGNSFNWLINDDYVDVFFIDKLAYSFGAGYGFKTPIGPLRLDYALPIYGPLTAPNSFQDYQSFANPDFRFGDSGWIGSGSFHIALGYSF